MYKITETQFDELPKELQDLYEKLPNHSREEVLECFPNTKSGNLSSGHKRGDGTGNSLMGGGGIIQGNYGGDSGSAARFFKECKFTNEDLCQDLSQTSSARYVVNDSDSQGKHIAQEPVRTKSLDSRSEASPASLDSTGNFKNYSLNQNPVSSVENQESIDTTQTTPNFTRLSGSAHLATDENTKQESQNSVNAQVQGTRFLYQAKASKKDRDEGLLEGQHSSHPTVKPTALMRYLVKLVTPPGGTVLDPFTGSGSTGKACKLEGFDFIGIEREEEYVKIAEARIKAVPDTLL